IDFYELLGTATSATLAHTLADSGWKNSIVSNFARIHAAYRISEQEVQEQIAEFGQISETIPISIPQIKYGTKYSITRFSNLYEITTIIGLPANKKSEYAPPPKGCGLLARAKYIRERNRG
ncbi:MAG: hypothetical protein LBD94_03475, partial [Rickettsiales bacterium]|nr:hypothetical protein [Rickettsiales bacterium]